MSSQKHTPAEHEVDATVVGAGVADAGDERPGASAITSGGEPRNRATNLGATRTERDASAITKGGDPNDRVTNLGATRMDRGQTLEDGISGNGESPDDKDTMTMLALSDRFKDLGRIGVGGMGEVHLVNDVVLLRRVAMKSLHPKLARKREHAERFLREVQITGRLDHPNIVPVHDIGFHGEGNAFFVMKHVKGTTLREKIAAERDRPLIGSRLEELLRVFLKLTDAIGFSHSRGVIHRDLKPDNIMVGDHGEVYVMDWGIALVVDEYPRANEDRSSPSLRPPTIPEYDGSLIGTLSYMSPEQAEGRIADIDFRTDVFGLGAILYEILTGQPPYADTRVSAQLKNAREGVISYPTEVAQNRRLPPGLCRIAMNAMAADPDERYQSVAALERDVQSFLRGGGWFETRTIPAGTVIVREGDEAREAYIIETGACEVYKHVAGERQSLRKLGSGDVFGETAIFTGKARTASVAAIDDVTVVVITSESLDYELGEKVWLAAFVRALAERFCDLDRQLGEINAGATRNPD